MRNKELKNNYDKRSKGFNSLRTSVELLESPSNSMQATITSRAPINHPSSKKISRNIITLESSKEIRAPPAGPLKKRQRVFIKEKSVFKLWREDNSALLRKALEYDLNKSKVHKLITDEIEYE